MPRALLLCVGLIILLASCTQKLICPAYQSSFIYDKETLRKKFSYFKEDSTPKIYTASKSKYLIAVPESYRKKMRGLKSVEMKPVYPIKPDSLKEDGDALVLAERDEPDSTTAAPVDSVYAITKTKEKYNVDQDIYMWYFRDQLVLPDVRAAMETQNKNKAEQAKATAKKKKKGLFSFLKKKQPKDSTAAELDVPADTTTTKKKGLLGIFGGKKNKSQDPKAPSKKKDDAKKDDDDGF